MRQRTAMGLVLVALALGGCSGEAATAPPASSNPPTAPTATSPSPSRTALVAPVGTEPVVECLRRSYRLVRFRASAPHATWSRGTGGDVELSFSGSEFPDGNYVDTKFGLTAAGTTPMTLTTPDGRTDSLLVDADVTAFYQLANDTADFALGSGRGSGTLTAAGSTRTLPLSEVLPIVTPQGPTTVSCTSTTLYLTGEDVQYELAVLRGR